MPPRHGKSETISHWFPVWYLSHRPKNRVILVGYGAEFASTWGRRVRNTISEYTHQLGVKIADDSSAADRWATTAGGGMTATGAGGVLIGLGADILIVDDPIKNSEEANSKLMRDKVWDWWQTVARTRLEPNGSIVVVMHRWSEDDLVGRLLASGGEKWEVINMPAIAEDDDAIGRKPGDPLWPERYSINALNQVRGGLSSGAWASLFQQRPAPEEGSLFKKDTFNRWTEDADAYHLNSLRVEKSKCWKFLTCDLALSEKTSADFSVIQTWASDGEGNLILLDMWRKRAEGPEVEAKIWSEVNRVGATFAGIEKANYGLYVIQSARRRGLPFRELVPDKDKVARAQAAITLLANGKMWFPTKAPWLDVFEHELLTFPNGSHDDMVDCVSYAARLNEANYGTKFSYKNRMTHGSVRDLYASLGISGK